LKGYSGILRTHAFAVVDHLNQRPAGFLKTDIHLSCTGIDGVFHQFLDDGGRPLHHFSGCNFIGNGFRQYVYSRFHDRYVTRSP